MMKMTSDILLTDRTTIATDWECGMKLWWYKLEGGTGIVPKVEFAYFAQGREIHDDLAQLARGHPVEQVISEIPPPEPPDQISLEVWSRRQGWVAAVAKWAPPTKFGEPVLIEDELVLDRTPLWIASTPDLVTAGPEGLIYRDYKTTGGVTAKQLLHWASAIQLHTSLKAVEEELCRPVAYGHILALEKGFVRDGRLVHPYVWAYWKAGEWSATYKAGWEHVPVWDYPGGIIEWVDKAGPEIAAKQLGWSEPIFVNERLLTNLVEQRIIREKQIRRVKKRAQVDLKVRCRFFEQRFDKCKPAFGDPCPYRAACYNAVVQAEPLACGLYVPRTPHHELELLGAED